MKSKKEYNRYRAQWRLKTGRTQGLPPAAPRGERNGAAVLTDAEREQIRREFDRGASAKDLARRYRCHVTTIYYNLKKK